jgi:phosphatidylglycerophosphatase A
MRQGLCFHYYLYVERQPIRLRRIAPGALVFFATGFGVGYLPWLPGTAGTVVAIPFSLSLNVIAAASFPIALLTLVATIFCAIWLSSRVAAILGQRDPALIVVDEIVGFLVANFMAPPGVIPLALAFLSFRFFDIAKVYPMTRLERLPGGAGIVLDDVMAGLYTFVIMRLISSWGLL